MILDLSCAKACLHLPAALRTSLPLLVLCLVAATAAGSEKPPIHEAPHADLPRFLPNSGNNVYQAK